MNAAVRLACWLLGVLLAGCATPGMRDLAVHLPPGARAAPDRYVVVTVRNAAQSMGLRAAGTARGYDGSAGYTMSPAARASARSIAADYSLLPAASWPIVVLGVHCVVYQLPPAANRDRLLERLAADLRVESAQPLASFATQSTPATYNDPYAWLQRNLGQMAVAEAQQWTRGRGTRVAIIDTGVDLRHPDLRGQIAEVRNFVDGDAQAFAADMHGTGVAGVIGALANNRIGIAGIAPDVTLLAYKACWQQPGADGRAVCNSFTLAQALVAAIDGRVDLVNLSLAGPSDPLLARLVLRGLQRGIVFVAAAPPAGARSGFPGDVDGVVMVDSPGRLDGEAAAIVAPGNDVLTLVPGGRYDFASGSSLAAAQASGVVALLLASGKHVTPAELSRVLARTSRRVATPSGTFNAINACRALVALRRQGHCENTDADPSPGLAAAPEARVSERR